MNGPDHYREAERLIDLAAEHEADDSPASAVSCYRAAQVHATLALAAATAYPAVQHFADLDDPDAPIRRRREWAEVVL